MNGVVPYAGWTDIPLNYFVCKRDRAVPASVHEGFAASLGFPIDMQRIDAGPCPFASGPEEVANIIRRAAGEETERHDPPEQYKEYSLTVYGVSSL